MVSFDVVSLFTSVPLDYTIDIILDKVYRDKLVNTKLSRHEFKRLLELCTKDMHFSFNEEIYKQINGVAMGSPLGPVLANIFMVELENNIIPSLNDKVSLWFRYVDDTFTFIKKGEVENVKSVLNGFHENIKFTHEREADNKISFLDVNVIKNCDGSFETDIYRKKTDTNVYLNWKSFAPKAWKVGTLKGLFRRAFIVCSTKQFLEREIAFLKHVFTKCNGYPSRLVNNSLFQMRKRMETEKRAEELVLQGGGAGNNVIPGVTDVDETVVTPHIILPYKGDMGNTIINKFKNTVRGILPSYVKPRYIYKGKKLGSFFKVKDRIKMEHQSDLVYAYRPEGNGVLSTDYVGETRVRYETRINQHRFTDKGSAVFKHITTNNINTSPEDFVILDKGYKGVFERKIAESLFIKQLNPKLNEQKLGIKLQLFN